MNLLEFRSDLSGKQSEANADVTPPHHPFLEGQQQRLIGGSDVRFGSEAEVANCPGVTAVSTSGLVSLDRNRRSNQPVQAASTAGSSAAFPWREGLLWTDCVEHFFSTDVSR